jgi:hypothetical protein
MEVSPCFQASFSREEKLHGFEFWLRRRKEVF